MKQPAPAYSPPPANVAPYVAVLGIEGAVAYLLEFGGAELYLARNPGERSRLSALVGHDKARARAHAAGFLPARVPLATRWIAACLSAQGHSTAEIARRLHTRDVTVRKWLTQTPFPRPRPGVRP